MKWGFATPLGQARGSDFEIAISRIWYSQESLMRRGDNEQQAFGHDGKTA
jgi:hypothetical protein